jgi:hypothetical protein
VQRPGAGEAVGLKDDFRLANQRRQDADGFENCLTTMLGEVMGRIATSYLAVTFTAIDGNEVCRVDVKPAGAPVFMRGRKSDGAFHVHDQGLA